MITGIDINQRVEFISKKDTGEPKTIIVVRPLSGFEMMEFSDLSDKSNLFNFLDKSIVEVKNYNGDKTACLNSLPLDVLAELITFVTNLNELGEADKKKS